MSIDERSQPQRQVGRKIPLGRDDSEDVEMDTPQRSSARWFRLIVVVGIAAIIGLLVWNLIADRQPSGGATPTTDSPTTSPSSSEPSEGPLLVAAGEGGSAVAAADGLTPVGYELTCTGAVQAATNYLVALTSVDSENLLSGEQYSALVDELTQGIGTTQPGGASSLKLAYQARLTDLDGFTDFHVQVDPAAGMFRVTACDGQTAVIDIVNPGHVLLPAIYEGQPLLDDSGDQVWTDEWYLDSARVQIQVSDGDWALVQLENAAEMDDDPVLVEAAGEYGDKFTPQMRAAVLAQVGPEWTEYTNAP